MGAMMMLFLSACTDILDEQPRATYEPGFFTTKEGVQSGLTSMYAHLRYIYGQGYYYNITLTGTDEYTWANSADGNFKDADMTSGGTMTPSTSRADVLWNAAFPNINTASGVINNTSNYGVIAVNTSSAVNEGLIQNAGDYGMAAYNGSSAENAASGIISNTGLAGMFAEDNNSIIVNRGTISNGSTFGMWISQGTGENYGIVENKSIYGMLADESGSAYNYGLIQNTGDFGMWSQSGATIVNQAGGIIHNTGNNGMNVEGAGDTLTTAINNGTIENTGEQGMSSTGANGTIINNGTIKNLSKYGMRATNNSIAINNGIIENNNVRGMEASTGATAINEGTIKNNGANGMKTK